MSSSFQFIALPSEQFASLFSRSDAELQAMLSQAVTTAAWRAPDRRAYTFPKNSSHDRQFALFFSPE
ncbi:MAG: hypothetical protein ACREEM_07250 [Blastocatellia bacterium]